MKKSDWLNVLFFILIIVAFYVIIDMYKGYKSDVGKCLIDPFVFGAEKLEQLYETPVTGTIFIFERGTMTFNSSNMISGETWQSFMK